MELVARLDMSRLAAALQAQDRHPVLVLAVSKAAAAGSTREDLRSALDALTLIERLGEEPATFGVGNSPSERSVLAGALFTQAVILYARATATKGERPKLLGEAKLSAPERATHDEAMKLRDSVLAHFGRGETLAIGPLVKDAVVLSLFRSDAGEKRKVDVLTTRAQHKAEFSARLAELIEGRLTQLACRHDQLFAEVNQALETAVREDPELGPLLPMFAFDVDAFCGSPEAAARLDAGLGEGSVEDMDYVVAVRKP